MKVLCERNFAEDFFKFYIIRAHSTTFKSRINPPSNTPPKLIIDRRKKIFYEQNDMNYGNNYKYIPTTTNKYFGHKDQCN